MCNSYIRFYLDCFPVQEDSPTEIFYQSLHATESPKGKLIVDLPTEHLKEERSRRKKPPHVLESERMVTNGKVLEDISRVHFPAGYDGETRRHSLDAPRKTRKICLSNDQFNLWFLTASCECVHAQCTSYHNVT